MDTNQLYQSATRAAFEVEKLWRHAFAGSNPSVVMNAEKANAKLTEAMKEFAALLPVEDVQLGSTSSFQQTFEAVKQVDTIIAELLADKALQEETPSEDVAMLLRLFTDINQVGSGMSHTRKISPVADIHTTPFVSAGAS